MCFKVCVFSVDYTVEALNNREFGSVFLGKENVAEAVVTAGWAKVCVSVMLLSHFIWQSDRLLACPRLFCSSICVPKPALHEMLCV